MPKTKWAPPRELPTNAIAADRWDRKWWTEAHEDLDRLQELSSQLDQVAPTGRAAFADLFYMLSKSDPQPEPEVRPDHAVNALIADQLRESEGVMTLRRYTTGSVLQSVLGCVEMQPTLVSLFETTKDAQDLADEAQEAQDELDRLLAMLSGGEGDEGEGGAEDGEPGEVPGAPTDEQIEAAGAAAQEAKERLGEKLDEITPRIGRLCREAAETAAEHAETRSDAMASWGTAPSEQQRMNPDEYLELADTLNTPQMARITEVWGKMRNLTFGAHKDKVDTVPTEVWSVELGNDVSRLLPSEYIGLIVPELTDDFYRRYAGRQLLQYRLRSVEHQGKGSVIVLEDGSGSMSGEKFAWAKGFGLAAGSIARRERREFHVIEFGSRGQHRHHPFPDERSWTTEKMLDYASSFLSGGTDFETILDRAVGIIDDEHERTGKVKADIVIVTDGVSYVSDEWLATYHEQKERLGFKVYALVIGYDAMLDTLSEFCDYAGTITNLTDGTDARDVFRAIA